MVKLALKEGMRGRFPEAFSMMALLVFLALEVEQVYLTGYVLVYHCDNGSDERAGSGSRCSVSRQSRCQILCVPLLLRLCKQFTSLALHIDVWHTLSQPSINSIGVCGNDVSFLLLIEVFISCRRRGRACFDTHIHLNLAVLYPQASAVHCVRSRVGM